MEFLRGGRILIRMLTRSATVGLLFDAMAFIAVCVTYARYNAVLSPTPQPINIGGDSEGIFH